MARAWSKAGHAVTVATPLASDHRGLWGELPAVRAVHAQPRRWPSFLRHQGERWDARRLVAQAIRNDTPDLIWERHTLFCDAGMRVAATLGIPRIVELNAPLSLERPGLKNRERAAAYEGASLRSATRVVAVSQWLATWAVERMGCAPERVLHVPNGTSLTPSPYRQKTRADLGLSGLVIGFAGSCKPFHHLDLLPEILEARQEATALVIGDGPCPPPEHPRLRHLPRVPETALAPLISAMDVGLNTSAPTDHPWRCPLKILDYQSQGVPVVSADVGDAHFLLPNGILVTGRSPAEWANAIGHAQHQERTVRVRTWDRVLEEALTEL